MPIKFVGRTTDFCGKTLWEILGNLKNFGVGRIVVRSRFERYPEPCYYKIMKVEPLANEETRKVKVMVEKTFRGRINPKLVEICSASYKADYKLIPKDKEAEYCKPVEVKNEKIFPKSIPFPPLMKELVIRDLRAKGEVLDKEPELPIHYRKGRENHIRVAAEGEKPNVEIIIGLGKPVHPELYKGIPV